MIVCLTGARGFVGQNLMPFLKANEIITNGFSIRSKIDVKQIPQACKAIIHLAGIAHDLKSRYTSQDYHNINCTLAIDVFEHFITSDINDFYFFSTINVLGNEYESLLTENNQPNPQTNFSISKFEAEQYLLSQPLPQGKRLFIIRPCMIHGSGNKGNLNLLYKLVEKGIPWPLLKFENRRSFLSIDNLCYLILAMLNNKDLKSGIYNFADDETLSTNKLIRTINIALGKKAKFLPINKNLIQSIAILGDKIHLPLNSERLKKLTGSNIVSNQKIKTALGIEKLPYTAEEGLIKTIKSFKK